MFDYATELYNYCQQVAPDGGAELGNLAAHRRERVDKVGISRGAQLFFVASPLFSEHILSFEKKRFFLVSTIILLKYPLSS